jgi:hypothetical protein
MIVVMSELAAPQSAITSAAQRVSPPSIFGFTYVPLAAIVLQAFCTSNLRLSYFRIRIWLCEKVNNMLRSARNPHHFGGSTVPH